MVRIKLSWPFTSSVVVDNQTVELEGGTFYTREIFGGSNNLIFHLLDGTGAYVEGQQVCVPVSLDVFSKFISPDMTSILGVIQSLGAGSFSGRALDFSKAVLAT